MLKKFVLKWLGIDDLQEQLSDAIKHWEESIIDHNKDCPRYIKDLVKDELRKARRNEN